MIIHRLFWVLIRRFLTASQVGRFKAGWKTFSWGSSFAGYNALYGAATVINSRIGRFTYVNNAKIYEADIGSFCSIGPGVRIGGLGKHPTNWVTTHPAFYSVGGQSLEHFTSLNHFREDARTTIGNDVWIAAEALILDGVAISDGAIVAAGSVVAKDVPAYAVVGGVPARIIRRRFSDDIIAQLIDLAWWDWPVEQLRERQELFVREDPQGLIASATERPNDDPL